MSYQALARKWRPRRFDQLVGQNPVRRALVNALESGRIHPAYLFTGTRGVGKTTLARLLAKCLNCERGVSAEPCGVCEACVGIDEGRFIDLIEVDAASRTKVEDTRELLENVQYAPVRGRYKVYLIDEVHMLSGHSFNALLKTLEEPPPHVQFLLATTDPQKIPATILSRCVQFSLKRIPAPAISQHLAAVLEAEGVPAEPDALHLLATAADGSLRDALSLLDQAIAYGGGRVAEAEVREMLGILPREAVLVLLRALADRDGAALMRAVETLAGMAADFDAVLGELQSVLHRLALIQLLPQEANEAELPLRELAERLGPEDVQLFYQITLLGRRDLPHAADPRSGFEMILLRMLAFQPAADDAPTPPPRTDRSAPPAPRPETAAQSMPEAASTPVPEAGPGPELKTQPVADGGDWGALLSQLKLRGLAAELASHCVLDATEQGRYRLKLARSYEGLLTAKTRERLSEALAKLVGHPVKVEFQLVDAVLDTPAARRQRAEAQRLAKAQEAIEKDPLVQALQERFDAQIVPDSIEPNPDNESTQ